MPEAPGPWVDEFRCTCGDHIADYRKTRLNVTWMDGVNRLRERNSGIEGGGYRSRGPVLRAMNQIKMERWYAEHVNCNTCEIVRDHKDWWTEQEDKARSEGFEGKWEWCEPDDDDQDEFVKIRKSALERLLLDELEELELQEVQGSKREREIAYCRALGLKSFQEFLRGLNSIRRAEDGKLMEPADK